MTLEKWMDSIAMATRLLAKIFYSGFNDTHVYIHGHEILPLQKCITARPHPSRIGSGSPVWLPYLKCGKYAHIMAIHILNQVCQTGLTANPCLFTAQNFIDIISIQISLHNTLVCYILIYDNTTSVFWLVSAIPAFTTTRKIELCSTQYTGFTWNRSQIVSTCVMYIW